MADPVSIADIRAQLARHFLFRSLPPESIDCILNLSTEREYANGQIIFQAGEAGTSMLAVLRGQVKINVASPDGKEILFNTIRPGEVFGEIAVLDGKPRSADATAVGACKLLVIRRSDFVAMLKQHPDSMFELLLMLCTKLRDTTSVVESVGLLDIPARLARYVLKLAEQEGEPANAGVRILLKVSQRELGDLIGATRESVNKTLRSWHQDGVISLHKSEIIILQEDALDDIASGLS